MIGLNNEKSRICKGNWCKGIEFITNAGSNTSMAPAAGFRIIRGTKYRQ
jgi:hypothetical protein